MGTRGIYPYLNFQADRIDYRTGSGLFLKIEITV
jgi:hypothetical protein